MTGPRTLLLGLLFVSLLSAGIIDTTDPAVVAASSGRDGSQLREHCRHHTDAHHCLHKRGSHYRRRHTVRPDPGVHSPWAALARLTRSRRPSTGRRHCADAISPANVLGSADMSGNTNFGGFIEVFSRLRSIASASAEPGAGSRSDHRQR
jgi:hypothetical protein